MDYIFVPNFMKIRRGQDFFVDLAWNDPIAIMIIYNHTHAPPSPTPNIAYYRNFTGNLKKILE